jgi:PAS domain S-box-containing protein
MIRSLKTWLKSDLFKETFSIIVPIWAVMGIFILSVLLFFIPSLENGLTDQKKEIIRTLTRSAVSLLSEYQERTVSGELTLPEAKSRARERIRYLRYGAEGKDYFWIIDRHPFMIMHPYRPELEGRDMTSVTDIQGNFPFIGMVETALNQGEGYVNYYWQWKDAPHKIVPKISYVKMFEPWGWIVGTGIYVEDVQKDIRLVTSKARQVFTAVFCVILALSAYITWQTIRIRNKKLTAERAAQKEKEILSMILESTPHGITLIDRDDQYLYVNPYFTKITGYTLADIPDKQTWFQKAYPDPDYRQQIIDTWETDIPVEGKVHVREFKITCRDGQIKDIEFRSSFALDKKISVLTDITQRKEAEAIRREKDRLQGVLELSGAVCHEMNQPLMSISGYFDLILLDMPETDPHYPRIKKIQAQLERMAGITQKMMRISRYRTKDYLNGKILDLDKAPDSDPEKK